VIYTNWQTGYPESGTGYPDNTTGYCIQMNSEDKLRGKWSDISCEKKNLVVCQKLQTWSNLNIQNVLLNISRNPVPIGFIYVQLSGQPEPKAIWPQIEWKDITIDYAGLFFRAEGGNSSKFGDVQGENSPRIIEVYASYGDKRKQDHSKITPGGLSEAIYSGSDSGRDIILTFLASDGEVRPRNQAIRIWKRII